MHEKEIQSHPLRIILSAQTATPAHLQKVMEVELTRMSVGVQIQSLRDLSSCTSEHQCWAGAGREDFSVWRTLRRLSAEV